MGQGYERRLTVRIRISETLPDYKLYHAFGEDRSSFGLLTYKESKERRDMLNKFFSQSAVIQAHDLIIDKVKALNIAGSNLS